VIHLKILFEDEVFTGTPTEIIDQFRRIAFDADDFPDCDSFLWYMQNNYVRLTELPCDLPDGDTDMRAKAMLEKLDEIDALMIVEDA
jgi:hypothetical protein